MTGEICESELDAEFVSERTETIVTAVLLGRMLYGFGNIVRKGFLGMEADTGCCMPVDITSVTKFPSDDW